MEARNRVGGRIKTVYGTNNAPIEIGSTWFTLQHKHLIELLKELDIAYFEQHIDQTVFYETSSTSPVQIVQIPNQANNYRVSGVTSSIINVLRHKLDETDLLLNQSIKHIKINHNSDQVNTFECNEVVLVIPTKLWSKKNF